MSEVNRVEWVDALPIAHEPSEPANCNSTAAAISSYFNTFAGSWRAFTDEGVSYVAVAVFENYNAAFPICVIGTTEGVAWRALLSKSILSSRRVNKKNKYVWELIYEVERRD